MRRIFVAKPQNQISSCSSSQTTRVLEFRKLDDRNLLIAIHPDETIYLANQEWVLDRAAAFASPQAYCAKMLSQSHYTEPVKQFFFIDLHPKHAVQCAADGDALLRHNAICTGKSCWKTGKGGELLMEV